MTSPGSQTPGWYSDPSGQPQMRWWDGATWTDQTQPGQAPGTFQPQSGYPAWSPAQGYGQQQAAGNGLSIAGIVCGVIALLILPIVFGPVGLILGGIAKSKREPRANIALIVAAVGMVGGFIIGAIFTASVMHY